MDSWSLRDKSDVWDDDGLYEVFGIGHAMATSQIHERWDGDPRGYGRTLCLPTRRAQIPSPIQT